MNIHTLVSCFLLFAFTTNIHSQTDEEIFERDIKMFMDNTGTGNFDAVLDLTYPKLFTLVPREQMKAVLGSMLDNPEMKITIAVNGIEKIHEPVVEGTETFRRIDYNSAMRMELGDEMWEQKEMMISGMKMSMGDVDIIADDDTQALLIDQLSTMIAIQEDGASDWKYLQFQADQAMMLKAIIPEAVIQKMFETE